MSCVTGVGESSQCGQGMALFEGIVPAQSRSVALDVLRDGILQAGNLTGGGQGPVTGGPGPHLTAGMFGIKWVLMVQSIRLLLMSW